MRARTNSWVVTAVAISLVGSTLGIAVPAGAESVSDPAAPVAPSISSALWSYYPAKAGGGLAAYSRLTVAPGGSAVWGAQVTAGGQSLSGDSLRLQLSGFPAGTSFTRPAASPAVDSPDPGPQLSLGDCQIADTVTCAVNGQLGFGQTAIVPILIHIPAGAPRTTTTAMVGLDGQSATTDVVIKVQDKARDQLFVAPSGEELSRLGLVNARAINVYNLGGSKSGATRRVRLGDVLPSTVATKTRAKGRKWSCSTGQGVPDCVWKGKLPVGHRSDTLTLRFKVPESAGKLGKVSGGTRKVSWRSSSQLGSGPKLAALDWLYVVDPAPAPAKPKRRLAPAQPDITPMAVVVNKPRLGGTGQIEVRVNNGGGVKARNVRVGLDRLASARVVAVNAPKSWRCSLAVCTLRKPLKAHGGAAPISFELRNDKRSAHAITKKIRTVVTWQGLRSKRTSKPVPTVARKTKKLNVRWDPTLTVSTRGTTRSVISGDAGSGGGTLVLKVGRLAGKSYEYTWQQVCPGGRLSDRGDVRAKAVCPAVKWSAGRKGTSQNAEVPTNYSLPRLKNKTTLQFRVTVAAEQAKIVKTVKVKAVPAKLMLHNARLATTQPRKNWEQSFPPKRQRSIKQVVTLSRQPRVKIVKSGSQIARAGKVAKLEVRVKPPAGASRKEAKLWRADSVSWKMTTGPAKLLRKARYSKAGKVIRFTVPKTRKNPIVVSVAVRYAGKRISAVSRLLTVQPAVRSADVRLGSREVGSAFCDLYDQARDSGLTSLEVGSLHLNLGQVAVQSSDCQAPQAAIDISSSDFTFGDIHFTEVKGSITADGLAITGMTVTLPGASDALAKFRIDAQPGQSLLSAAFTSAGLDLLVGSITLPNLPYLPLPAGWHMAEGGLVLTRGGSGQLVVNLDVKAVGQQADSAVELSGQINSSGSFSLTVTAANLLQLAAANGSTMVFSGSGTITRAGGNVNYDVRLNDVISGDAFPIIGNMDTGGSGLSLNRASARWNQDGLHIDGLARVALGDQGFNVTISGVVSDYLNWRLDLTGDGEINLRFLKISNLSGAITMSNTNVHHEPVLGIELSGGLGFTEGIGKAIGIPDSQIRIDHTTVYMGTYCNNQKSTVDDTTQVCPRKTFQMEIDLDGQLNIDGSWSSINSTVRINLETGRFNIEVAPSTATGFGPADLNLSGVEFFYTDEPSLHPALQDNACMTSDLIRSQRTIFGATAQYSLKNGWHGQATLVYVMRDGSGSNASGYCISAAGIDPHDANSLLDSGGQLNFDGSVNFVFTSFETSITVNGVTTALQPNRLTAIGFMALPSSIKDMLGNKVQAVMVTATFGLALQDITIWGDLVFQDSYLIGNSDPGSLSLRFDKAGLFAQKVGGTWSIGIKAQMLLHTPGSPPTTEGGSKVASGDMTIIGYIYVGFGSTAGKLSFGLELTNSTHDLRTWESDGDGDGYIKDAFGLSGLNLRAFKVGGTIAPKNIELGVAASVVVGDSNTTLGTVAHSIGLTTGTPIDFAFGISSRSICFALGIGDPSPDNRRVAIDWGGFLQAKYVTLVFAPDGCPVTTSGMTTRLQGAGYAFAFDGNIFGNPTFISGTFAAAYNEEVKTPAGTKLVRGPFFSGQLQVDIGGFGTDIPGLDTFGMGGVNVEHTVINLAFSTYTMNIDLDFSGGLNILGIVKIHVDGQLHTGLGLNQFSLKIALRGESTTDILGVYKPGMTFDVGADFRMPVGQSPYFESVKVHAEAHVQFLIINAGAGVDFDYSDGIVKRLSAKFSVDVSIYIASVGGSVEMGYDRPTKGDDGRLFITVKGHVRWWLFGWHESESTLLDTSVPIITGDDSAKAPPPFQFDPPPPPESQWPHAEWNYTTNMFMGINWDRNALASAAGVSAADLRYGVATTAASNPSGLFYGDVVTLGGMETSQSDITVSGKINLPPTPTNQSVVDNYRNQFDGKMPTGSTAGACQTGVTKEFSVKIPSWDGQRPSDESKAAFVIAEVNWRMYLASVVEATSIANATDPSAKIAAKKQATAYRCGYDDWDRFPSLQSWTDSQGVKFNLGYPVARPDGASQFCRDGLTPGSDYAIACQRNLATLGESWGVGWGVSAR